MYIYGNIHYAQVWPSEGKLQSQYAKRSLAEDVTMKQRGHFVKQAKLEINIHIVFLSGVR